MDGYVRIGLDCVTTRVVAFERERDEDNMDGWMDQDEERSGVVCVLVG